MKRFTAWDIETCPTPEALEEAQSKPYPEAERKPPGNYKKPEAISNWYKEDREEWEAAKTGDSLIKDLSTSPRTGRIVAFGSAYHTKNGYEFVELTALNPADEKDLIVDALTMLADKEGGAEEGRNDLIVGFNSRQFDWPFLMLRAMYHRIDLYEINTRRQYWADWNARYPRDPKYNVDVREMLTFGDKWAKGTLSEWGAWAGEPDKSTHGGQIYEWVKAGDADSIKAHVRGDAYRTGKIFERVYNLYPGS